MARPKGLPKTGGRQPGTVNKSTARIKELAAPYSEEAIEILVAIARDTAAPPPARVAAVKELLDRGHGRPAQSVDVGVGEDGQPLGPPRLVIQWTDAD